MVCEVEELRLIGVCSWLFLIFVGAMAEGSNLSSIFVPFSSDAFGFSESSERLCRSVPLTVLSRSVGAMVVQLSCRGVVCSLWLTPSPGGPVPRLSSASCLLFPGEVEGFVRAEPLQVG